MTAKEYLQQAYRLDELIASDKKELDALRELSTSLSSQDTSRDAVMSSGSNSASFTKIVDKIADLEAKIKEEIEQYIALKSEIRNVIDAIQDKDEKLCLRYRYIEFLNWEQIAERMNYSLSQTTRIHGRALQSVVIPEKMT